MNVLPRSNFPLPTGAVLSSMRVEGSGFTVVTARRAVPIPTVARPFGLREHPRPTGLVWPVDPNPQVVRVVEPPKRKPTKIATATSTRPTPKPPTEQDVEAMAQMYAQGKPLNEVALATKFSRSTVAKYLHKAGVAMRPAGSNTRFRKEEAADVAS